MSLAHATLQQPQENMSHKASRTHSFFPLIQENERKNIHSKCQRFSIWLHEKLPRGKKEEEEEGKNGKEKNRCINDCLFLTVTLDVVLGINTYIY